VAEAEAIIEGVRKDWGEHDANYVEFGFFSGARPSELIALLWPDADRQSGYVRISKARVMGRDKKKTKTAVVRDVELNPRALAVLKRQRALTGLLEHERIFTRDSSEPWNDLQLQWQHWRFTHKRLGIRYREPYQMRHTSVTWNLMIGKNLLWVAQQHGHSPAVMLKTYAKWLAGSTEKDIEAIRAAMGFATRLPLGKRGKN
jgi:integrase